MVRCHKEEYRNSRLRLEYAYLLFNKFILNRINSELIKIGRILTPFSVTDTCCNDTSIVNRKRIYKATLVKYVNKFCHHFEYKLLVCDTKSNPKIQEHINFFAHAVRSFKCYLELSQKLSPSR